MASNRNKRPVRNTKTGANAMQIQRKINMDYADLARDYKKLGIELWQMPVTKFIVGGAAIGALVPVFMKLYRGDLDMETIKSRWSELIQIGKEQFQDSVNE